MASSAGRFAGGLRKSSVDRTGGIVRITFVNRISYVEDETQDNVDFPGLEKNLAPPIAEIPTHHFFEPKMFTIDRCTKFGKLLDHYLQHPDLPKQLRFNPKGVLLVGERGRVLSLKSAVGSACVDHQAKVFVFKKAEVERPGGTTRLMSEVLVTLLSVSAITVFVYFVIHFLLFRDRYGLVIDAGSTHTEVSVYKWNSYVNGTGEVEEVFNCQLECLIGVANFKDNPEKVRSFLLNSSCLRDAVAEVPRGNRNLTPIVLGGTGGLRALLQNQPEKAESVLRNADAALGSLGLAKLNGSYVRVLTGIDEAVYGWISTNYMLKRFGDHRTQVGSLDWGGASSEVTFPYDGEETENVKDVFIFNRTYRVYVESHRCYGQEKAMHRYFVSLIYDVYKDTGEIQRWIKSPCQPGGLAPYVKKGSELMGRCTTLKDDKFNELLRSNGNSVFEFVGDNDVRKCGRMVDVQFNKSVCSETYKFRRTCFDVDKPPRPADDVNFVAFSTYWYLAQVFQWSVSKVKSTDRLRMSRLAFANISNTVCHSEGVHHLLVGWGTDRTYNSCFRALFMLKLLVDGYGHGSWDNITFANTVNGKSAGWSLGFMLDASRSQPPLSNSSPGWQIWFVVFLAVAATVFAVAAYSCHRLRKMHRGNYHL